MNSLIFLFGASCAGKSTLSEALHKSLGTEWIVIERDDLIERGLCIDATANSLLDEKVQAIKNRVIIDAQIPWRERREGELYFLVLPPLQTLLQRVEWRTTYLKRNEERVKRAKEYVFDTYQILHSIDKTYFNRSFDSSQVSVEEEVQIIRTQFLI